MVNLLPFTGYVANPKLVKHMIKPPIEFANLNLVQRIIRRYPQSILRMANP